MSTENIDDLFRRQLGDHATPPGDDLWARLQAGPGANAATPEPTAAAANRVDQLYQHRLKTHATPPPREIWERLEDEHLRPRQRRPAAAWWPMALAAAVALLLLAGGAGLWWGFPGGAGAGSTVASQSGSGQRSAPGPIPTDGPGTANARTSAQTQSDSGIAATSKNAAVAAGTAVGVGAAAGTGAAASQHVAQTSKTTISGFNQKNLPARATRSAGPASSASKVGMMALQSPRRPRGAYRQPDAAAASAPLVARTTAPPTAPAKPTDEPAPVVAATNLPTPAPHPAVEIVPATTLAATNLITVDVRNGAARRPSLATAVASAAAVATEERRGLGGRLLRQVGHAVRGERLSLSEVTGLPENLTLEATIGGRRVSKSIQL